jgi:hypothetical protein
MWAEAEAFWKCIADNTKCKVFSAGINKGYDYPYRLVKPSTVRPSVRDRALELILDSGFNNDDVTNEEIIELAQQYNPDYIIPKDYPGRPEETVEMMKQFFDMYDGYNCHARPYVVVQPPYMETFLNHQEFYGQFSRFALGGMRDWGPKKQVAEIVLFNRALRTCPHTDPSSASVHAFGVGPSPTIIMMLRERPHLLDSLDVSTFEQVAKNNRFRDVIGEQVPIILPRGDNRRDLQGLHIKAMLFTVNYALGTKVDEADLYECFGFDIDQTVEEYAGPAAAVADD